MTQHDASAETECSVSRDAPRPWVGDPVLLRQFSPNPSMLCFAEINRLTLQLTGKGRGFGGVKTNVKRTEESGECPQTDSRAPHSTACDAGVRSDTQTIGADETPETINTMMAN